MTVLQPEGLTLEGEEREPSFSPSLVNYNEQFKLFDSDLNCGSFGRRRSFWFYYSKYHLKKIRDLGKLESLDQVLYGFERWRESYVRKAVHLAKGDRHIFIRQYSRFDVDYRSNLRSKMRMLDLMLWDLKIELTVDPKRFFRLIDEFNFIVRAWNKLRSWLKKRYGSFEFLRVLEVQKSGRPHLHILLSGIKWISHQELSDVWSKYGAGEVVYLKSVYGRSNLKATAYVLKYVNKTLSNVDKKYSALLFASNKRVFGLSRGAQNMVNVGRVKKEPQGFEFLGSVSVGEVEAFLAEQGIEFGFMARVTVSLAQEYEYGYLFCESGG